MANLISVDIEADGPCPDLYSMISLGAVEVDNLSNTWYGEFSPMKNAGYIKKALESFNMTREQTLQLSPPLDGMESFHEWLQQFSNPRFMSDNAGFDWQFVNYYLHYFIDDNPFGFSPFSLTSWAQGAGFKDWKKKFRITKHTHNALDDAMGNAEAYIRMTQLLRERR